MSTTQPPLNPTNRQLIDALRQGAAPIFLRDEQPHSRRIRSQASAVLLVDPEDYETVMRNAPFLLWDAAHIWRPAVHVGVSPSGQPSFRTVGHWLMGLPTQRGQVEYLNGDVFDCRRANLRIKHRPSRSPTIHTQPTLTLAETLTETLLGHDHQNGFHAS